jgi:GT2 family glycosyltransferase
MSKPLVAIVILNWNGRSFLEQFLPSVMASTYSNLNVVVADNASTDDSVAFVREHYPTINLLINASNEGFAQGYNTALKQVEADYYVLLNSDVEVTPGWIEPIITRMESDHQIAACQPKLLSFHQREYFEYAGACGGWIDAFGYPFTRGRVIDICEKDEGQYDQAMPCFWATGAALFVRASVYRELGGLDGSFFAHQEEIDLCWRMQLSGYKVFVEPASVVYHVGGGTLPRGNARKVYLNFRNNLIMMAKNMPWQESVWKLPVRFALDALAAYKGLLEGNRGYWWAIAKAHLHFLNWLLFGERETPRVLSPKKVQFGKYTGMMIWAYYARGRKRFFEIVRG